MYTHRSGCIDDRKVPVTAKLFKTLPEAHAKGVVPYLDIRILEYGTGTKFRVLQLY